MDTLTIDMFAVRDAQEGVRRRDKGVKKVSDKNHEWLDQARSIAMALVAKNGTVSSDDIHEVCPPPLKAHPNVMGAVFRGISLKVVGFKQTIRPSGHGRMIKVYGK